MNHDTEQCWGTTAKGNRCRKRRQRGERFCATHAAGSARAARLIRNAINLTW